MHLTFSQIELDFAGRTPQNQAVYRFKLPKAQVEAGKLDQLFFFSVPTSFFVLDERIPGILRELLTEAHGCLKSNFLTGGSACARKIVYELAALQRAEGNDYESRIKSLKKLHPEIQGEFFDTLLTIQQVTSSKVHENSYDKWIAKHLRIILASLSEVLHELYVIPAVREDKRKAILALKEEVVPKREPGAPKPT